MPAKFILGAGALVLSLSLGGCADYLDRRDSIALSAGNAVASNRIIQTIDPYPRNSFRRGQSFDGIRAEQASRNYHTQGSAPLPGAQGATTTTAGGTATQ